MYLRNLHEVRITKISSELCPESSNTIQSESENANRNRRTHSHKITEEIRAGRSASRTEFRMCIRGPNINRSLRC